MSTSLARICGNRREVGYQLPTLIWRRNERLRLGISLEISAQSPHPLIGVEPLEYTITAEDVRQGWIQLPALVAYEIPAETALLHQLSEPV